MAYSQREHNQLLIMVSLSALLFLLGSSAAMKLRSLGEQDATVLVDLIIGQLKDSTPDEFTFPSLAFGFSALQLTSEQPDNSSYIGKLTSLPGWVADMKSLHRASPVVSVVKEDNLTLSTSVSFGMLRANWAHSELNILGVSMIGDTYVTFRQNEFAVKLTIYNSSETGACAVDLQKAGFSVLSAIDVSIRPIGFFNQIHLDATVNHLSQSIFDQFTYIDVQALESTLQSAICKALPN